MRATLWGSESGCALRPPNPCPSAGPLFEPGNEGQNLRQTMMVVEYSNFRAVSEEDSAATSFLQRYGKGRSRAGHSYSPFEMRVYRYKNPGAALCSFKTQIRSTESSTVSHLPEAPNLQPRNADRCREPKKTSPA